MEKLASEAYSLLCKHAEETEPRSRLKHMGVGALAGAAAGVGLSAYLGGDISHAARVGSTLAIPGAILGAATTNHKIRPGVGLAFGFLPAPRLKIEHKDTGSRSDLYFI